MYVYVGASSSVIMAASVVAWWSASLDSPVPVAEKVHYSSSLPVLYPVCCIRCADAVGAIVPEPKPLYTRQSPPNPLPSDNVQHELQRRSITHQHPQPKKKKMEVFFHSKVAEACAVITDWTFGDE